MGLDGNTMVTVFGQGACAAPMFALKGPKLCADPPDHGTHFPLKHAHKDMLLAREAAEELGVSFGINARAEETFKRARDNGMGDLDFSAVYVSASPPPPAPCYVTPLPLTPPPPRARAGPDRRAGREEAEDAGVKHVPLVAG